MVRMQLMAAMAATRIRERCDSSIANNRNVEAIEIKADCAKVWAVRKYYHQLRREIRISECVSELTV